MDKAIKNMIAQTFDDIAAGLETGSFGGRARIAVSAIGSEHGEENIMEGALIAQRSGVEVVFIGSLEHPEVETIKTDSEDEAHKIMEDLLKKGDIQGAVAMHYPFPIGVSTVGKSVAPATGKNVYISTTTGTSSTNKTEALVRNAIYGIIAAKADGVKNPTLGFLNLDGARQTATIMKKLQDNGYDIEFAESKRSDGGNILRGNDLLTGAADVVVCDSLTGNILIKMMSSYSTGGSYEAVGQGYGPGVSESIDDIIMIISRASGAPVVAGAIQYAASLAKGNIKEVAKAEFKAAKEAGLNSLLEEVKASSSKPAKEVEEVKAPPKEIVSAQIAGIEIMELDDAVQVLWKEGIYAESGMGCTGPIVMISEANKEKAKEILIKEGYVGE